MQNASVSIALCTFNGGLYLASQLRSIKLQSRLPDEIVICDDASSDSTLDIVETETSDGPIPIRLFENKTTLGPSENFGQAISRCEKSIIVLCDQDDFWRPTKIERAVTALLNKPEAAYVFSDAICTDDDLVPKRKNLWRRVKFTAAERHAFDRGDQLSVLLKRNVVTGATMAFRSELRDYLLPIPSIWMHDAWIALLCSALGKRGIALSEPLVYYRHHSNQVIGSPKSIYARLKNAYAQPDAYEREVRKWELLLARLSAIGGADSSAVEAIGRRHLHAKRRLSTKNGRLRDRLKVLAGEAVSGNYGRYANGWKTVAKDLLFCWRSYPH